jgi:hypothetical protein
MMKVLTEGGFIDFYLGTSRDGATWDLDWVYAQKPIIPRGPAGSFDQAGASPFAQPITWKDRHWLYYGGMNRGHKNKDDEMAIGLATVRLDGFVSLSAGDAQGAVVTRPFTLKGSGLELNVDASRGHAFVEVLDAAGRPLPQFAGDNCRRIEGVDGLRLAPRWKGQTGLGPLQDRVVRLKIHLRNAHLYAFGVSKGTAPGPEAALR